jgi:hypothetical protein
MIAILISWLVALIVFESFGKMIIRLCDNHHQDNYGRGDVFFIGFSIVGAILVLVSLWMPLTGYTLLALVAFSVIFFVYDFIIKKTLNPFKTIRLKFKSLSLLYKILIVLTILVLLVLSLLPPLLYDTGLYHWQAMKWIETYPVVPGLGNIHGRFGFNSSALLLHSVFSMQDIFGSRIFGLNGLLFLVLFSWIVFRLKEMKFIPQLALFLLVFVLLRYYDVFIASPNTDLMPAILVVYLFLRAIFNSGSLRTTPLLYLLLPVFIITLKLSQIPICLFCLFVLIGLIKNKQYKTILSFVILSGFIFIPWCVRTTYITGYPIYPYPAIDLFHFDWEMPLSLVEREKNWVLASARMVSVGEMDSTPFIEWGKFCLMYYFYCFKTVFFTLCLAGISPLVVFYGIKCKWIKSRLVVCFWLMAVLGTLFWMMTAPNARFGLGFILVAALGPFLMFSNNRKETTFKTIPAFLLLFSLVFFLNLSFKIIKNVKGEISYQSLLYKPQTFDSCIKISPDDYATHTINGITIYVPTQGDQCFDQALPCSPGYCYPDSLEMRGKSIKEGFRVKKLKTKN